MDYNDYELIYMAREQNEDAVKVLTEKYRPLLEKKARDYYVKAKSKGYEYKDFLLETMVAFEEALFSFNPDSSTLFYTFVNICVDRQMNSTLLKVNRIKHKNLNESISLDYNYEDDSSIIDFIRDDKNNPENLLFDINNKSVLYNKIICKLTKKEREVLELKINGYNYIEIADVLNRTPKEVSNTLYRIKLKIKEIINE